MKVLFVCTGNTCRSPMAEGIFDRLIEEKGLQGKLFCQSAGLSASIGTPVSQNAVEVCDEIGVDISKHKARKLSAEDTQAWDLYFTMSKTQAYILEKAGAPVSKIHTASYIDDPYGEDIAVYRECRDKLEIEIGLFYNNLVERLLIIEGAIPVKNTDAPNAPKENML